VDIELGGIWNGCISTIVLVTTIASAGLVVICSAAGICSGWESPRKRKQVREARIGRLERIHARRAAAQTAGPQYYRQQRCSKRQPKMNRRRLSAT
jgi:hypothetical protein